MGFESQTGRVRGKSISMLAISNYLIASLPHNSVTVQRYLITSVPHNSSQLDGRVIKVHFNVVNIYRMKANRSFVIGWSNNHFNNLHFIISLETTQITTCAAKQSFMSSDSLKRRSLK